MSEALAAVTDTVIQSAHHLETVRTFNTKCAHETFHQLVPEAGIAQMDA